MDEDGCGMRIHDVGCGWYSNPQAGIGGCRIAQKGLDRKVWLYVDLSRLLDPYMFNTWWNAAQFPGHRRQPIIPSLPHLLVHADVAQDATSSQQNGQRSRLTWLGRLLFGLNPYTWKKKKLKGWPLKTTGLEIAVLFWMASFQGLCWIRDVRVPEE